MNSSVLEVADLTVRYNARLRPALESVCLTLNAGEICALTGDSGCGKTTLGWALSDLLPLEARILSGSIRLSGRELLPRRRRAFRAASSHPIVMVSQDPVQALNPVLSIQTQVEEVVRSHDCCGTVERRERVAELLGLVGLSDARFKRAYPGELSGGQQQRVVLAQALATRASILIADEPTTALDERTEQVVVELLSHLRRQFGLTVLLITHDLSLAKNFADRILELRGGIVPLQSINSR